MTELLHTAPLILRRHGAPPNDPAAGRRYELFDAQWRLVGNARAEGRRGGGRRLLSRAPSQRMTVFDAEGRPLLGMEDGSGRRAGTTRVLWADGTPVGVFRRGVEAGEFDLVDSHGRDLGRLEPNTSVEGRGQMPAALGRSHHRILDPSGQEVATLTREFLPNTPGRYPPQLLTYTLRPHRETPAPLGALLRLMPMATDGEETGASG